MVRFMALLIAGKFPASLLSHVSHYPLLSSSLSLSLCQTHGRDPAQSKIAEALAGLIYVWKMESKQANR